MPANTAVIFDMDGVLIDTEAVAQKYFAEACAQFNLQVHAHRYLELIGQPTGHERDALAKMFGPDTDLNAFLDHWGQLNQRHWQEQGVSIKAGAPEVLAWIKRQQLPLGLASTTSKPRILQWLTQAELVERFDAIVSGHEVPRHKPAPDVYLEVARQLGVAPQDCWAVEDSYTGIASAHAAGMQVIMVPDLLPPTDEVRPLVTVIVDSLREAQNFLAQRLNKKQSS